MYRYSDKTGSVAVSALTGLHYHLNFGFKKTFLVHKQDLIICLRAQKQNLPTTSLQSVNT
jgi:hypothetical protein